jgi:hypothetical protein
MISETGIVMFVMMRLDVNHPEIRVWCTVHTAALGVKYLFFSLTYL